MEEEKIVIKKPAAPKKEETKKEDAKEGEEKKEEPAVVEEKKEEKKQRGQLGQMRVDEVHKLFSTLMPPRSQNFYELYKKAWNPTQFGGEQ